MDRQRIDAEVVVERGMNFAKVDRAIGDLCSVAVGCTDDLTCSKSAACDQAVADIRPVIAARFGVDSRCPTEFTPCHNSHVFIEAPFVKVGDQRVHPLIEQWEVSVLTFAEIA